MKTSNMHRELAPFYEVRQDLLRQNLLRLEELVAGKLDIGIELEFYLNHELLTTQNPLEFLNQKLSDNNLNNITIVKEQGTNQFEAIFQHETLDTNFTLLQKFDKFKSIFAPFCDFTAYHENKISCGLHIHFNLVSQNNLNLFAKEGESESVLLLNSVAGLLKRLNESLLFFTLTEACFKRYSQEIQTPSTVSWGYNNRTCAIRIPETGPRRLEHRIASSQADIYLVLLAIINAIIAGIEKNEMPPEKIYGVSYLNQYQQSPLANYEEAKKLFHFHI